MQREYKQHAWLFKSLAALRAARFASISKGSRSSKVAKDFTQMAMSVQKYLRMTIIMILNNPY